jgi:ATP-binding cassette subfamily C (CFTR/MRP) protein 1
MENASFAWERSKATLNDISVSVPRGKLVAVVGKVGAGKSSLVSAILGEMHKISGKVSVQVSLF